MLKKIKLCFFAGLIFFVFTARADYVNNYSPWSLLLYYGSLSETNLVDVFGFNANMGQEKMGSVELEYELSPQNFLRRYFTFITTISFANNISYISDPEGPIYEYNPFLLYQWKNFPWDKYVVTSFGIGWGVSYDSRISTWEKHDSDNTKKLLDYLAFETAFALPAYPRLQLVVRLHHRSGAFGLYGADNAGSNFIGGGLRYNF